MLSENLFRPLLAFRLLTSIANTERTPNYRAIAMPKTFCKNGTCIFEQTQHLHDETIIPKFDYFEITAARNS